jgi:hypothetical protein
VTLFLWGREFATVSPNDKRKRVFPKMSRDIFLAKSNFFHSFLKTFQVFKMSKTICHVTLGRVVPVPPNDTRGRGGSLEEAKIVSSII